MLISNSQSPILDSPRIERRSSRNSIARSSLPEHFGHNFDALADVLEDRDWLGKSGHVIALAHAATYRKDHPKDWATLEDLLAEAAEFWKERHVGFWTFVA